MDKRFETRREQLTGRLRSLYESLGYSRFSMRRFEEYALYLENKSFLKSESVLAFTNPDGVLMALKPDVTLSIVKHARREREGLERVYYQESVYRLAPTAREFVEIDQLGVELLGELGPCAVAEIVRLAIESLAAVGPAYVLDVSHMGFASGLLEAAGLPADTQEKLLTFIRQKNAHELAQLLAEERVPAFYAERIGALATLSGAFPDTLARAEALCVSADMEAAVAELRDLYAVLSAVELSGSVQLDFSMLNDQSYYNGVVFQGYVEGAPRVVLSGGRYDPLMRRFGKAGDAIGFAMYLDELDRVLADVRAYDADVLALYREGDDTARVSAAVFALAAQGVRVFAATRRPADMRAARTLTFTGEGFEEVLPNA